MGGLTKLRSRILPILNTNPTIPFVAIHTNLNAFDGALDTCSTYSLITMKLAKRLSFEIGFGSLGVLRCANKSMLRVLGTTDIEFKLGHKFIIHKFKVVSELQFSCIIGLDIITNYGIVPNIQHGYFYFNDDPRTKYDVVRLG